MDEGVDILLPASSRPIQDVEACPYPCRVVVFGPSDGMGPACGCVAGSAGVTRNGSRAAVVVIRGQACGASGRQIRPA